MLLVEGCGDHRESSVGFRRDGEEEEKYPEDGGSMYLRKINNIAHIHILQLPKKQN
jgi:hypothetical protein